MLLFLFSCFHTQKQTLSDVTVPTELGPYGTGHHTQRWFGGKKVSVAQCTGNSLSLHTGKRTVPRPLSTCRPPR